MAHRYRLYPLYEGAEACARAYAALTKADYEDGETRDIAGMLKSCAMRLITEFDVSTLE
jgi:hypothetical protein